MTHRHLLLPLMLLFACSTAPAGAQTILHHDGGATVADRKIDGTRVERAARTTLAPPSAARPLATTTPAGAALCDATPVAWHGLPLPDGEDGTLSPLSFMHAATLNNHGRIAFAALVDDAARNQGVFTADADGLRIVALGCGPGGGSGSSDACGDPSPIGGTFTGFFLSTFATPDINDAGDVLFLADVTGGSAPRGLFLYRATTGTIVKVATVGDPSPLGGTITRLGMGSMNNVGTIAFLATTDDGDGSDVLLWQDGTLTKYVAAGDPAPGGGTFWAIGTEFWGFEDGSSIAGGPVPGINESGQVSFRGYVSGGVAAGGLFLGTKGTHEWLVRAGDAVPGGGTYNDFGAPLLNNNGEIAFFSETSDTSALAWVVGKPGQWRRALAPYDAIGDGIAWELAYSRNPMNALADNGDLAVWTRRFMSDSSELNTLLVSHADASLDVLAVQGTPTPFGGSWGGSMDGWPSINQANQLRVGSATPGFALSADVVLTTCASSPDVIFRDGFDGGA
jgi:hypothetical protein